jgi:hypothetical protein
MPAGAGHGKRARLRKVSQPDRTRHIRSPCVQVPVCKLRLVTELQNHSLAFRTPRMKGPSMEYLIGTSLALAVSLYGAISGLDRDRAFYPIVTVVVASYYELFAVMGGSSQALGLETAVFLAFAAVAVAGFKFNLWLIAAALIGHGIFDLAHPHFIANPGVPSWWPMFCLSYDVSAGLYLAWLLGHSTIHASPRSVRSPGLPA